MVSLRVSVSLVSITDLTSDSRQITASWIDGESEID